MPKPHRHRRSASTGGDALSRRRAPGGSGSSGSAPRANRERRSHPAACSKPAAAAMQQYVAAPATGAHGHGPWWHSVQLRRGCATPSAIACAALQASCRSGLFFSIAQRAQVTVTPEPSSKAPLIAGMRRRQPTGVKLGSSARHRRAGQARSL